MNNHTVDVYIYVTSKDVQQFTASLVQQLAQVIGVASVGINSRVKSLLAVKYDPSNLTAGNLLSIIKQQGHSAALIGM